MQRGFLLTFGFYIYSMINPPLLRPNDQAIIVSPSGALPKMGIENAKAQLSLWGLHVSLGEHVFSVESVFAGSDVERLSDFQKAIDNPNIRLIMCARGGVGITRYMDKLSFEGFIKNPKWIVGFSDVTAFHLLALNHKLLTVHGPMGTSFARKGAENSILHLKQLLFNGKSKIVVKGAQLKQGECEAEIVGGNLSLLCDSLGTPTEVDTVGKILVLEDVGDYYYRMDRMLNQLVRAHKFDNLKGLVIGNFSDLLNGDKVFTESIDEIITRLTSTYNYPIASGISIGHNPENYSFVQGARYHLNVSKDEASLKLLTKL